MRSLRPQVLLLLALSVSAALGLAGCAHDPPLRAAGSMTFHTNAAAIYSTADAALAPRRYSIFYGNNDVIIATRSDPTAAAPFTTIAGVLFVPIGVVAGLALSPIDGNAGLLPLAALPIMDSGYVNRYLDIQVREQPAFTTRVTVRATHPDDAAALWSALLSAFGPAETTSECEYNPPLRTAPQPTSATPSVSPW